MKRRVVLIVMTAAMFLVLAAGGAFAGIGSTIRGTDQDDRIVGTDGNDTIDLLAGKDFAMGTGGNDRILGRDGQDRLNGSHGNDTLIGGRSEDRMFGRTGDDILNGVDSGLDHLVCGTGFDRAFADAQDVVFSDCEVIRRS